MFASESTGVLEGEGSIHSAVLKSYKDARMSLEKCRSAGAYHLISPHFGMVPDYYIDTYWRLYEAKLEEEEAFISSLYQQNLSEKEMLDQFTQKYWSHERSQEQPIEAFLLNAKNTIKAAKNE